MLLAAWHKTSNNAAALQGGRRVRGSAVQGDACQVHWAGAELGGASCQVGAGAAGSADRPQAPGAALNQCHLAVHECCRRAACAQTAMCLACLLSSKCSEERMPEADSNHTTPIAQQVVPSSAPTPVKNVDSPADPRKSDILTGRAPPRGRKPTSIGQAVQHAVGGGGSSSGNGGSSSGNGSSSSKSAAAPAAHSASASPTSASIQTRGQAAGGAAAPAGQQSSDAGTLHQH